MSERDFERVGGETVYDGTLVSVSVEHFRFPDGEVVRREIVKHPGAVAIVVHDGEHLFLVRQPRETVYDPDSLELPAGKLDGDEQPLAAARRELAEEVGLAAADWILLTSYYSSIGMSNEEIFVYLATGVSEAVAETDENERIEIVRWPLNDLAGARAATKDAKTIIGLLLLEAASS